MKTLIAALLAATLMYAEDAPKSAPLTAPQVSGLQIAALQKQLADAQSEIAQLRHLLVIQGACSGAGIALDRCEFDPGANPPVVKETPKEEKKQ